jgi:hypothetical protein
MGSNSFKRIVGSFENGRCLQHSMEKKTLGVGDDLSLNGRISDTKLAEIDQPLSAFKASCAKEGAERVVAIGTAAFREAPNGARVSEISAKLGIPMEIATEQCESELVYRVAWQTFFADAADVGKASLAFREQLTPEVAKAPFMRGQHKLVGVEFEAMVEVLFEPAETEGRVFSREELRRRLDEIVALRGEALEALEQKRDIDRALPRLVIAATLPEAFGGAVRGFAAESRRP